MPISLNILPGDFLCAFNVTEHVIFSVEAVCLESNRKASLKIRTDDVCRIHFAPGNEILLSAFIGDEEIFCRCNILSVIDYLDDYENIVFSLWVRPQVSDFVIERHDIHE